MIRLESFLHCFGSKPPLLATAVVAAAAAVVVAAAAAGLQQPAAGISVGGALSPHSLAVVGADGAVEARSPTVADTTGQSFAGSFYLAYR
jgi:hypothetical protein